MYFNLRIVRKSAFEVSRLAKYNTKQRKLLLAYLSEHADEILPTGRIVETLAGKEISASAIYRNLSELEQEGKLRRSSKPGSQEVFYRFTGAESCQGHLHLRCLQCGKTVHMEQAESDIAHWKAQLGALYALLDLAQAEQAAAVPGSKADARAQKQIITLGNQIHSAEAKLSKAQHIKKTAERELSAA